MALFGSIAPIWPLPGALAAFIAGGMGWPVPFIALAAGTAEPIGELTYYSIGYGSQPVLQKSKWYARLQGWMKRRGGLTIFLLSMIPNPIIRFADVAAAGLRYPLRKFIPFCWTGKMIKSFAFAAAGAGLFPALTHLAERIL
jgi:membrane protein DedA with SNARE-associated domain